MYKITYRQPKRETQELYTKEEPTYFLQILSFVDIEYLLVERVGENDGIIER